MRGVQNLGHGKASEIRSRKNGGGEKNQIGVQI
jgi:hypothetical protein